MKLSLSILVTLVPTLLYAQNKIVINGLAPQLKDGSDVFFSQIVPKQLGETAKQQVVKIENHRFNLLLNSDGAEQYSLTCNGNASRIFLGPGNASILIADSLLKKVAVSHNTAATDYDLYRKALDSINLIAEYSRARRDYDRYSRTKNADGVLALQKMQKRDSLETLLNKQFLMTGLKWIKENPHSFINTYVLFEQMEYMEEQDLKNVFSLMPSEITRNTWASALKYRIDSLSVGAKAPDFSQADTSGKKVSLASFRGKYVLLDFWASWCPSCRAENPNVINAVQKLDGKNFTVVSISMDQKNESWINAIKQDRLNWTQLSSLQGWGNPLTLKYYISSVPTNYLIGPDGKIVAKNLYGADLYKKIATLMDDSHKSTTNDNIASLGNK